MSGGIFDLDSKLTKVPIKKITPVPIEIITGADDASIDNEPTNVQDIQQVLTRYIEIPQSAWGSIPIKTYIRYISLDKPGELKKGGRVRNITLAEDKSYNISITARGYGKKKGLFWVVNTKKISKLYKFNTAFNNLPNEKSGAKQPIIQQPAQPEIQVLASTGGVDNVLSTPKEKMLNELGGKLLFGDSTIYDNKISALEFRVQKQEDDIKKLLLYVKQIYSKLQILTKGQLK